MLEAALADVAQQMLHARNLDYARAAESLERIVGKHSLAHVPADSALAIVGGKPRVAHGPSLHTAHTGAEGVFLPYGSCDDLLKVHAHVLEEVLWQIAAVEAYRLVGI